LNGLMVHGLELIGKGFSLLDEAGRLGPHDGGCLHGFGA
jgi:hypothetical protein